MASLNKIQLTNMLELQMRLNNQTFPDWLAANFAWTRAIRVECAEMTDHLGWKWWKQQERNVPAAAVELVDIWHFVMSSALVAAKGSVPAAADEILKSMKFPMMEPIGILGKVFTLNGISRDAHDLIDIMSAFASAGYTFPLLVELLMPHVDLDWDKLYTLYVAKNTLNIFRQTHGYKQGTYVKVWNGREDNDVMQELLAAHPDATPLQLLNSLETKYLEVTASRGD